MSPAQRTIGKIGLAACQLLVILACLSCGGSGAGAQNVLPPAGKVTFQGTTTASTTADATVSDPTSGAKLIVSAGSMQSGASVQLKIWSAQRSITTIKNLKAGTQAFDITLDPSQFSSGGTIQVQIPWSTAGTQPVAILAFNTAGTFTVLASSPSSTRSSPVALISASDIQLLTGGRPVVGPITFTLAVEEAVITSTDTPAARHSKITRLAHPMTAYAAKKRIGIVVHGLFGDTNLGPGLYTAKYYAQNALDSSESTGHSYMVPLLTLMGGLLPEDSSPNAQTAPFDELYAFEYKTSNGIDTNGNLFASTINQNFGDKTKYEVHIIAHSMGGLVSRWAIEKNPCPSVVQLITLGSPHLGVPHNLVDDFGVTLAILSIPFGKGFTDLADNSEVVTSLESDSAAQGVTYNADNGTTYLGYTVGLPGTSTRLPLGEWTNSWYHNLYPNTVIVQDGIVLQSSAQGGPAAKNTAPLPYNHRQLVDFCQTYWPYTCGTWLYGINRKVGSIQITPSDATLNLNQTLQLSATAFDKDGAQLDPSLISGGLPVAWSVDNGSFASINQSGLLTGLSKGIVMVTATTPSSVATVSGKPISCSSYYSVGGLGLLVGTWAYTGTGSGTIIYYADGTVKDISNGLGGTLTGTWTLTNNELVLVDEYGTYSYAVTFTDANDIVCTQNDGKRSAVFYETRSDGNGNVSKHIGGSGPGMLPSTG